MIKYKTYSQCVIHARIRFGHTYNQFIDIKDRLSGFSSIELINKEARFGTPFRGILKDDVLKLQSWFDDALSKSSALPTGAYFFEKKSSIPRNKFSYFCKTSKGGYKRVVKIDACDVIVIPDIIVKEVNYLNHRLFMRYKLENTKITPPAGIPIGSWSNEVNEEFVKCSDVFPKLHILNCDQFYDSSIQKHLQFLIDVYNNSQLHNVKFVLDSQVIKLINEGDIIIDNDIFFNIADQLSSPDEDVVRMGLEIMGNCNFKRSIGYLLLLLTLYPSEIRYNKAWNTVEFKSMIRYIKTTYPAKYFFTPLCGVTTGGIIMELLDLATDPTFHGVFTSAHLKVISDIINKELISRVDADGDSPKSTLTINLSYNNLQKKVVAD